MELKQGDELKEIVKMEMNEKGDVAVMPSIRLCWRKGFETMEEVEAAIEAELSRVRAVRPIYMNRVIQKTVVRFTHIMK